MSDEIVKRLRDRRHQVWDQAKKIASEASDENRAFTAEEQGQWDALNTELDQLDARMKSSLETASRAKATNDEFDRLYKTKESQRGGGPSLSEGEAELRAFCRGDAGAPRVFEVRPPAGSRIELRNTLTKGSLTAGGDTVPTAFYDRLIAHLIQVSGLLQAGVTVLNTGSGEQIQVPKTTAHSTALLTAEAGAITASDPVFGQAALGAFKYGILVQVARELVDDTGVDLEGYLAMQAGRALGNALGADLITGTGSGQPTGLMASTTVGVTGPTGVSGGFGAQGTAGQGGDALINLFYSVIAPYRSSASCAWLMRDATMAKVRTIQDTTGQYLFQPSLVAGTPDTLIGKPLYSDPFMPAQATGAKSVAFGDLSQYFVRLAGGVRFERSDEFAFGNDLITFRALLRGDGVLVDQTGAVKHFAGPST